MVEALAAIAGILCALASAAAGVLALRLAEQRLEAARLGDALRRVEHELKEERAAHARIYSAKEEEIESLTERLVECSDPGAIRSWLDELLSDPADPDRRDDP